MTIVQSAPGVYIGETALFVFSVSSHPTAVPALFYDPSSSLSFSGVVRIDTWIDFYGLYQESFSGQSDSDLLYVSVRSYFENGGGYCYLMPTQIDLETLKTFDDITLLVACGVDISALIGQLSADSSLFAILDVPDVEFDPVMLSDTLPVSPYCAAYYPWLCNKFASINIPPSTVMAGVYCRNDKNRGVWTTPANIPLVNASPVTLVSGNEQSNYTINQSKAINMIRSFAGRGVMAWGARTTDISEEWRYIAVRRLFLSAERDIRASLRAMVFEPNCQATWVMVKRAVAGYLNSLWRLGGLQGRTPAEAYYVRIGEHITMTAVDVRQGKMIVEVGMAAQRPAEFMVVRFSQDVAGTGGGAGGSGGGGDDTLLLTGDLSTDYGSSSALADGETPVTAILLVTDDNGAVPGVTVQWTVSGSASLDDSSEENITDSSGQATCRFTDAVTESVTVTAIINGELTASADVAFSSPPLTPIEVTEISSPTAAEGGILVYTVTLSRAAQASDEPLYIYLPSGPDYAENTDIDATEVVLEGAASNADGTSTIIDLSNRKVWSFVYVSAGKDTIRVSVPVKTDAVVENDEKLVLAAQFQYYIYDLRFGTGTITDAASLNELRPKS